MMTAYQNMTQKSLLVSVVILTFNEEKNIGRCLASLNQQDFSRQDFEILIIDNGSSDRTCSIVESFLCDHKDLCVSLIHSSENNLGFARNLGFRRARADFVAFTDADVIVPSNWLSSLFKGFQKNEKIHTNLAAVGGGNLPPQNESLFYDGLFLMTKSFFGHFGSTQSKIFYKSALVDHLSTVNVLYHKPSVVRAGSFSSEFSDVCEDVFLSCMLKKHGYNLLMLEGNVVTHFMDNTFLSWTKRMFRFGKGQMRVCRFFPKHFSVRLSLPIVFLFVIFISLYMSLINLKFLLILMFYLLFVFGLSIYLCRKNPISKQVIILFVQFLTTHFSYAAGQVWGIFSSVAFFRKFFQKKM